MADEFSFQLRVTGPEGEPWLVHLPATTITVGRDAGVEVVLNAPGVEPYHALVNALAKKCQVIDLGSSGGTFLGQERLKPNAVADVPIGGKVTIGPYQLVCEQVATPPPSKVVVIGGPTPPTKAEPAPEAVSTPAQPAAAPVRVAASPIVASVATASNGNGHAGSAAVTVAAPNKPKPAASATPTTALAVAAPPPEIDDASLLFRKKALEKLQSPEQLNEIMTATSPKGWLVLAALVLLLLGAVAWSFIGVVENTVIGNGMLVTSKQNPARLEAVLYLMPADAARLQPGMLARVSPVSVRKEEYGMLVGTVTEVRPTLATIADMKATVGNDALAQSLIGQGRLVEVRVTLNEASTPSGYSWTSANGPDRPLQQGTVATGNIVVSQEQLISFIF